MTAVKGKLLVARQERKTLGDGMGYDDMVAGVTVILRFVNRKTGVGKHREPWPIS
ncbi:MAG: hypothetical protein IKH35_07540 [Prevotella sp.]|nr:hypothetical protein [Prevotella sp.]